MNSRGRSISPMRSGGDGSGGGNWRGEAAVEWLPELLAGGGPASAEEIGDGRAKSVSFPVRCICSLTAEEFDLFRGATGGGWQHRGQGGGGNVARFSTAGSGGTDSWNPGGTGRRGTGEGWASTGGGRDEGRIGGGGGGRERVGRGGSTGGILEALRSRKAAPYELIIPPIPVEERCAVLLSLLSSRTPTAALDERNTRMQHERARIVR